MALLTAKTDSAAKRAFVDLDFDWSQLVPPDPPLKVETSVSTGYVDVSSPRNWLDFGGLAEKSDGSRPTPPEIRDELLAFNAQWATLGSADRKALVEMFVYPASATTAELDALYTAAERAALKRAVARQIAEANSATAIEASLASDASGDAISVGGGGGGASGPEVLGSNVLSVAGDTLSVTGLAAKKFIQIRAYLIPSGGDVNPTLRFNNDSGSRYCHRTNNDNVETQATAQTGIPLVQYNETYFVALDVLNISTREKQVVGFITRIAVGSSAVPTRAQIAAKWVNTTEAINRVDILQLSASRDFATGSALHVYGHD